MWKGENIQMNSRKCGGVLVLICTSAHLFIHTSAFAQSAKIDSLKKVISQWSVVSGQWFKNGQLTANYQPRTTDTSVVSTLNELSWQLLTTGDYDPALIYANQALALANSLPEGVGRAGTARAHTNIGHIYFFLINYPEALKEHFASLKVYQEIGDKQGIADYHNNIGLIYKGQGKYPEALKEHFTSLKIKVEIGDKKGTAKSYNNIGLVYSTQGNYPEALKEYFAALKINEEIGDKRGIANSHSNIGLVYALQGIAQLNPSQREELLNAALKEIFASLKIREEIGDKLGIANCHLNIGNINTERGNRLEALKEFFAALKVYEAIGDKQGIAGAYINIGNEYVKEPKALPFGKDLRWAREWHEKALALGREIGSKEIIQISYAGLAQADSTMGNHKAALENYKMYIIYRDSLLNKENTKKTVQAQMTYEFEKKEAKTRAEVEIKEAKSKAEAKKQRIILWSVVSGLLAVMVFAIFIFRQRYRIGQVKKMYRVRTKISSDLHDDIGSTLTSIRLYSEMARRQTEESLPQLSPVLDKIGSSAGDMIHNMSDIVWAINPKNDAFKALRERMENFAAEIFSPSGIQYSFHNSQTLDKLKLSMEVRKNIFLIFKETVNNAAKYSGCKKVEVGFMSASQFLNMRIRDDGTGFDAEKKFTGNGLQNMRARAGEIHGELKINSGHQQGVTIELNVPL